MPLRPGQIDLEMMTPKHSRVKDMDFEPVLRCEVRLEGQARGRGDAVGRVAVPEFGGAEDLFARLGSVSEEEWGKRVREN
jgi:hypothetical protein